MDSVLWVNLSWIVGVVISLAINIAALVIIPRHRKPTAAMAWLLLIVLIPLAGILIFLLIGSVSLPRRRRELQAHIDDVVGAAVPSTDEQLSDAWPPLLQSIAHQNASLTGFGLVRADRLDLIADYQGSVDAMAAAIDTAQDFVHVEFFIVAWDDTTRGFFAAMERAVSRGVTVRLLADHIPSRKIPGAAKTFAELDRIGVRWAWMLPVQPLKGKYQRPDLRNHRKLVVVDGRVGFMGSQNLISRDYDSEKNRKRGLMWQELVTRVEGETVAQIDAVFRSDWLTETGEDLLTPGVPTPRIRSGNEEPAGVTQVIPSGPAYTTENNLRLFLSLIHAAQKRVIITSPYFVPDEAMQYAITTACQRGLDVQLFVSELGDQGMVYHAQRSYYEPLLRAGVRIFLYPAPYILHAKHFSIDDDVAVIGSSNMDIRSFSLNAEMSLLVRSASFTAAMRAVEDDYRSVSRELTLEQWLREPPRATFLDGVARLTSALN